MAAIIRIPEREHIKQVGPVVPVKAPQTAAGRLGEGLSDLGDAFFKMQDDFDTAAAKMADAKYSDLIRQELYADETGFMYSQGSDSMDRRQGVADRLQSEYKSLLDGLSPGAKAKALSSMNARRDRADQSINRHTATERRTYLNDAAAARLDSSINDAIYDPATVSQARRTAVQELEDMADREGWSPEVLAVKKREAITKVHAGVLTRLDAVDPIKAYEYLAAHKDEMEGDVVAKIEAVLVPKMREYRGRKLAEAAFNKDFIKYSNGGAVRNKKISPKLEKALSFLGPMGITMEVFSGGQAAKGSGGRRTGSTRHDHGHAADVFFYKDGRKLSWSNKADIPVFQEIVRRAKANGVTGFGAGPGYMRDGSMHIGFGGAATWGRRGRSANAPDWLVEAYNAKGQLPTLPVGNPGTALRDLLNIKDDNEREAAIRHYNLLSGISEKEQKAKEKASSQAAFELIERGGTITDLSPDERVYLGQDAMSSLRSYEEKKNKGISIATDDQFYVDLTSKMAKDPDGFMAEDPMTWRDQLSDSDFKYFTKEQSDMIGGVRKASKDAPAITSLRTAAKSALEAAGLTGKGVNKPDEIASFETKLLRWSNAFVNEQGREPTPLEVNEKINQMLVPIAIDPPGFFNGSEGFSFNVDLDGDPLDPDDDITPADLRDGGLRIDDKIVDNAVMEEFAKRFSERNGRSPTVREMIDYLSYEATR